MIVCPGCLIPSKLSNEFPLEQSYSHCAIEIKMRMSPLKRRAKKKRIVKKIKMKNKMKTNRKRSVNSHQVGGSLVMGIVEISKRMKIRAKARARIESASRAVASRGISLESKGIISSKMKKKDTTRRMNPKISNTLQINLAKT